MLKKKTFRTKKFVSESRGGNMFFPENFYLGILLAIIYCFVFWKLRSLGKVRIPVFIYSVVIQFIFLGYLYWYYSIAPVDNDNINALFFNSIDVFYLLLAVPLFIALFVSMYKGIMQKEVTKSTKLVVIPLFTISFLIAAVIGFYLHVFWYYGFAP